MGINRKLLLRVLLGAGGVLVGVAVLTPLGDFFVEYWRSRGVYDNPQATVAAVVQFFGFATQLWFQLFAMLVAGIAIGMWADDRWRRIDLGKAKPLKPEDVKKLGQEIAALASDMFRFLAERSSEGAARRAAQASIQPGDLRQWQADRDFETTTGDQFLARFGDRALGHLGRLKHLGIHMPYHLVTSIRSGRPNGIAQFLALMGNLLATGEIERATELSKDEKFIWQFQN